jgi:hypothetical protein
MSYTKHDSKICMGSMLSLLCGALPLLAVESRPEKPPKRDVLNSYYPELINGSNVWLAADLLYFIPCEKSIVMTNKKTDLFTTADVTKKPVAHPHLEGNFGYRLGLGYIFSARKWDMAVNWTHFNTQAHQKRSSRNNIEFGMFPIWSLADDILRYDWVADAKMDWKLNLNLLDLDFGYAFCFREVFFLRPFAGLRSAWIHQYLDVRYSGGIFVNGLNLPALDSSCGPDKIDMKNNFWGIGPQVGIEPQVNLGRGWRLYGNACGTLEYGFFDIHQRETYLQTTRYNRHRHLGRFRWIIDAGAGVLWKTYCARDLFALTFKLGWEYHLFFDQNELKGDAFDLVSDNRNLVLNGAAFSARFDF